MTSTNQPANQPDVMNDLAGMNPARVVDAYARSGDTMKDGAAIIREASGNATHSAAGASTPPYADPCEGRGLPTSQRGSETAEAYAAGYAEAIARLRDDERYRSWWSTSGTFPTGEIRRHLADYLEATGHAAIPVISAVPPTDEAVNLGKYRRLEKYGLETVERPAPICSPCRNGDHENCDWDEACPPARCTCPCGGAS